MDLWTTPDRLVMTDDRLATCVWPSRVLTSDGEQDKTDIRVTPMSILCHTQVTRESLLKLLCPSYVTRHKLPLWRNFKSDLRLTYVRAEWHTSPRLTYDHFVRDLQPTYEPAPSWPLGKSFPTVLNRSIRSGNLCRAMASPPSYCECSGVGCDLLTSNIGGTLNLADQLPMKCHFDQFLVVSHSQVPRDFGVTTTSVYNIKGVVQWLENTVTVINIASKTFTDSNPRPVVHCLLGRGGGYIGLDFPISQ